jgi:integrase
LAKRSDETAKDWRVRLTDAQRAELSQWQSKHRWSPHRLRHSAATRIRKEFGIESARVVLGHSAANVTGIYAEIDRQRAVEVMRQIG